MPEYATAQTELNNLPFNGSRTLKPSGGGRPSRSGLPGRARPSHGVCEKEEEIQETRRGQRHAEAEVWRGWRAFQKRQELIEPVQQQIFESPKDIASGSGYMVIFDKSKSNMLYTNPKYDISDRLIKKWATSPETWHAGRWEPGGERQRRRKSHGSRKRCGNRAKDNARDRMNSAVKAVSGGRTATTRPKAKTEATLTQPCAAGQAA